MSVLGKILISLSLLLLGAFIASLLNILMYRIPRKEKLVSRFHCDYCLLPLTIIECMPIIGWIKAKGKCPSCGKIVPVSYLILEVACAVLFPVSFLILGLTPDFFYAILIIPVLIILSLTDIKKEEIPYSCSIYIAATGLISMVYDIIYDLTPWYEHLIGAVIVSVPFAVLAFLGAMGGGDVQLIAAAGLLLGWRVVPAAGIGIILGAIGGVVQKVALHKDKMRFGPYLAVGVYLGLLFGNEIINLYVGMIR